MTKRPLQQIAQLRGLSDMILQMRLSELQIAVQARAQTQSQLQALAAPKPAIMDDGVHLQAALHAAETHAVWVTGRRKELTALLARETATWLDARDKARLAQGRDSALADLQKSLAKPPRDQA